MSDTLFDLETTPAAPERPWVDQEIARHLTGRPDAHLVCITVLDMKNDGIDAIKIEVVDAPPTKTGKRAGKPNYRKATNTQFLVVPREQWQTEIAAWEQRTGKCARCVGTGDEWAGWSIDTGTRFRPCQTCGATGAASNPQQEVNP